MKALGGENGNLILFEALSNGSSSREDGGEDDEEEDNEPAGAHLVGLVEQGRPSD